MPTPPGIASLCTHEPQLRGKVDHAELRTPLTTRDFVGHQRERSRFEQDWLRPHTPIEGLWMTGQDIATAVIGRTFAALHR